MEKWHEMKGECEGGVCAKRKRKKKFISVRFNFKTTFLAERSRPLHSRCVTSQRFSVNIKWTDELDE